MSFGFWEQVDLCLGQFHHLSYQSIRVLRGSSWRWSAVALSSCGGRRVRCACDRRCVVRGGVPGDGGGKAGRWLWHGRGRTRLGDGLNRFGRHEAHEEQGLEDGIGELGCLL